MSGAGTARRGHVEGKPAPTQQQSRLAAVITAGRPGSASPSARTASRTGHRSMPKIGREQIFQQRQSRQSRGDYCRAGLSDAARCRAVRFERRKQQISCQARQQKSGRRSAVTIAVSPRQQLASAARDDDAQPPMHRAARASIVAGRVNPTKPSQGGKASQVSRTRRCAP